jgi:hypothetical protein
MDQTGLIAATVLTQQELAELLRLPERTLEDWRLTGRERPGALCASNRSLNRRPGRWLTNCARALPAGGKRSESKLSWWTCRRDNPAPARAPSCRIVGFDRGRKLGQRRPPSGCGRRGRLGALLDKRSRSSACAAEDQPPISNNTSTSPNRADDGSPTALPDSTSSTRVRASMVG